MEEKNSFGSRVEAFFAGKGFYIVLFLCVAVIGVSAWVMLRSIGTDVDKEGDVGVGESSLSETKKYGGPEETISVPEEELIGTGGANTSAEVWSETEEPVAVDETSAEVGDEASVWPCYGEILTKYSMDALVYDKTMADWRTHDGVDIAADIGEQVRAISQGTVKEVYSDDLLGTTVVIDHGDGLESSYSNLAQTPPVVAGDAVSAGDIIGAVGDTAIGEIGESSHLHVSVKLGGESVNPADYLPPQ